MNSKKKTVNRSTKKLSVPAIQSQDQSSLYDEDFYKWTKSQSSLLRKGEFEKLDLKNIIEEIETLGDSNKERLFSFLVVLLHHLLKNTYALDFKGNSVSWDATIANSKKGISKVLKRNPSLRNHLLDIVEEAYEDARELAIIETRKTYIREDDFPEECPWNIREIFPDIKFKKGKE